MAKHRHHSSEPNYDSESSPMSAADRYAHFQEVKRRRESVAQKFADRMPFDLDDFQMDANLALEHGSNVLVAAPTGAGKTVVADFAVYLAQQHNAKAFYTTPIKALSNQKYHDLVAIYGPDKVGLLTGDTSINSEADIVVMTTEVLRNMLYENSTTLQALRYVVLDEVHYLADRFRGPVWEEVIIHLPKSVRIVGLSATVSNVEDFAKWITSVRGDTKLVVSEHRPVPLDQYVLVQKNEHTEPEVIDLYRRDARGDQTTKLNGHLVSRMDQLNHDAMRKIPARNRHERRRGRSRDDRRQMGQRYIPKRWAVVDELDFLHMLPAIYFIFSRTGCDIAVEQCLRAGLRLTTDEEVVRIRQIVDEMIQGQLTHDDLKTLEFTKFRYALEEGFAAHHAGMVALFRQIVERLFEEGLIKVVFATETLALGINMPARSVVIEKLEKYDGTGVVALTPGEYTQLTGRAGRRGIDTIGNAIVVDNRDFKPEVAASLSSKRVYPLHSSFRPTFNMAVNLLNSSDYEMARSTLDHSFAQWEANESSWKLEANIDTLKHSLQGYERAFACEYGDFEEFMRLRMELSDLQKNERRRLKHTEFPSAKARSQAFRRLDDDIALIKQDLADHPCNQCPDLQEHLRWGHRWAREQRELARMEERYETRTGSVARQFDTICNILASLGYLVQERHGDRLDYTLTAKGQLLRRLYSERDLLLAEAITQGLFDDLDSAQLASVLSALIYESRRTESNEPRRYPGGVSGKIAIATSKLSQLDERLAVRCEDAGLNVDFVQPLDMGIVDITFDWASGETLSGILEDTELTGGDFVRNSKRLADMLQQIAVARPYLGEHADHIADAAGEAFDQVNRGIVAYSGVD